MSKRVRFFYNGLLLSAVGLVMRAVGLFLGAYISGVIGAEGIGLQSLIGTVYSFAVTLATSGVGLSVTRLVAASIGEGRADGERILRGAFMYAFLFGLGAQIPFQIHYEDSHQIFLSLDTILKNPYSS